MPCIKTTFTGTDVIEFLLSSQNRRKLTAYVLNYPIFHSEQSGQQYWQINQIQAFTVIMKTQRKRIVN